MSPGDEQRKVYVAFSEMQLAHLRSILARKCKTYRSRLEKAPHNQDLATLAAINLGAYEAIEAARMEGLSNVERSAFVLSDEEIEFLRQEALSRKQTYELLADLGVTTANARAHGELNDSILAKLEGK